MTFTAKQVQERATWLRDHSADMSRMAEAADMLDAYADLLEARAASSPWQPISDEAKDGHRVLLATSTGIWMAAWNGNAWYIGGGDWLHGSISIFGWCPLPAPPPGDGR